MSFSSVSLPRPLQVLGAVLGAEAQVLRRMDWSPPPQNSLSRILGNRRGISKSKNSVEGRVRVPWDQSIVRVERLKEVMLRAEAPKEGRPHTEVLMGRGEGELWPVGLDQGEAGSSWHL